MPTHVSNTELTDAAMPSSPSSEFLTVELISKDIRPRALGITSHNARNLPNVKARSGAFFGTKNPRMKTLWFSVRGSPRSRDVRTVADPKSCHSYCGEREAPATPTTVNLRDALTPPDVVDAVAMPHDAALSHPVTTKRWSLGAKRSPASAYHSCACFATCFRNFSRGRRRSRVAPSGRTRIAHSFDCKLKVTVLPSVAGNVLGGLSKRRRCR
ncbi:hypothetical protein DFH07DRAFT_861229 [Mycena maculata]|uniref:Uncharacterized protein n=1 Tax=Mycena maculata TaxID=230809 RepID=A0AAD7MHB2_9AGAR|nr:hypothetical protein DFH07DRAFT_861229 [Mycena maculata]